MAYKAISELNDQEFANFVYERLPDIQSKLCGNSLEIKLPTDQVIVYTHFHRLGMPDVVSIQIRVIPGSKVSGIFKFDTLEELNDIIEISKNGNPESVSTYIREHLREDR